MRYPENPNYIPRVAAVHDLCGYGKCSLGVAIPVLSAAGCDVCPVPTGVFSSHTAFPGWFMHDTTEALGPYLDAWEGIGVEIDAIYSGFLGAPEQVDVIRRLYNDHPDALRFVDPVMADHGKVYPTYTPELCQAMVELASDADVLTPNLTEAAIILGIEWPGENISDETAHEMVRGLLATGAKSVVLKGIQRNDGIIRNFIGGNAPNCLEDSPRRSARGESPDESSAAYSDEIIEVNNAFLPYMLHGTGDLYASCLLAAIMTGCDLVEAARFAGDLVHDAMIVSADQPDFEDRGVSFEPLLGRICALLAARKAE